MEYHSDRFEDFSLMVYDYDTLIALFPANILSHCVYSHQGLTYGGLVYQTSLKFKYILASFKAILEFLNAQNIRTLDIKLVPDIYCNGQNDTLNYALQLIEAENYRTDILSVVNPSKQNYSRDRLAGYKRGLKHNLVIKETSDFSEFWNRILLPNLWNKHRTKPVHTLEEIELLASKFPSKIRQFNVYHDNQIVAGTTIFDTTLVAHSQYISGNAEKNKLGSLDFLHIHLLNEVFNDKSYFDFGISNENNGKSINEGLFYWKQGFGALPIKHQFFQIKTANYMKLDVIFI